MEINRNNLARKIDFLNLVAVLDERRIVGLASKVDPVSRKFSDHLVIADELHSVVLIGRDDVIVARLEQE